MLASGRGSVYILRAKTRLIKVLNYFMKHHWVILVAESYDSTHLKCSHGIMLLESFVSMRQVERFDFSLHVLFCMPKG